MLEKKKTGEGLEKYFGLIKDDKESVKLTEELKKGWKRWTKRYSKDKQ